MWYWIIAGCIVAHIVFSVFAYRNFTSAWKRDFGRVDAKDNRWMRWLSVAGILSFIASLNACTLSR